jgi:hypothetical protein
LNAKGRSVSRDQDPFRNVSKKMETLWQLTNVESFSDEERAALSFAVVAVQFAMVPERVEDFGTFLESWPPPLTSEQEARWADLDCGNLEDD